MTNPTWAQRLRSLLLTMPGMTCRELSNAVDHPWDQMTSVLYYLRKRGALFQAGPTELPRYYATKEQAEAAHAVLLAAKNATLSERTLRRHARLAGVTRDKPKRPSKYTELNAEILRIAALPGGLQRQPLLTFTADQVMHRVKILQSDSQLFSVRCWRDSRYFTTSQAADAYRMTPESMRVVGSEVMGKTASGVRDPKPFKLEKDARKKLTLPRDADIVIPPTAKITICPTPRGRFEVEPGFRGGFVAEWQERRA